MKIKRRFKDMENNLMVTQDVASVDLLQELKNPTGNFYCSIPNTGDRKSAVAIFNAVNGADEQVADHIGEVLEIVNVVAHPIELADEVTGEVVNCLRVVLIDKNGKSYVAVSQGIASAISRIFSIIGMPDNGAWEKEPVKMKIKQVKTRNGNNKVNTIELV